MQYLLLIHDDEKLWASMSEEERNELFGEYKAFGDRLREAGDYVGANQLQPTSTATTVHVRDGETVITDGPYAETKEQLGGYYLIEVDSLDDALEWAARIPSSRISSIEVRPVVPARVTAEAAG